MAQSKRRATPISSKRQKPRVEPTKQSLVPAAAIRGVVFDSDEPYSDLRDVLLTEKKFSCKYHDYQVEATSSDGIVYIGNWGYPDLDDAYTVTLTRFESKKKEIVLLGAWKNSFDNYEGVYLFRLNQ